MEKEETLYELKQGPELDEWFDQFKGQDSYNEGNNIDIIIHYLPELKYILEASRHYHQGDMYYLFQNKKTKKFIVFESSYGSCSTCDMWEIYKKDVNVSFETYKDVVSIFLQDYKEFENIENLLKYYKDEERWSNDDLKNFLDKITKKYFEQLHKRQVHLETKKEIIKKRIKKLNHEVIQLKQIIKMIDEELKGGQ